ncbi:MAG TPA: thioredoxin domain-containing protein [Acidimicrobiia bacterium]|nr:thioredoxin domain-containing protein [Acidimicrobiia bacterium]
MANKKNQNKRRGPKPSGEPPGRPAASAKARPARDAGRSARRSIPTAFWIAVAVVAVAGVAVVGRVVGVNVQSDRSGSDNADVVIPRLGPDDGEDLGDLDAPVVVQEFADFQCPACRAFFETTQPTIDQLIIDRKVRFVFSNFAFIGPESFRAASAARCAADFAVFWEYHGLLYENQSDVENGGFLRTDQLIEFGRQANIPGEELPTFEECVREDRYDDLVREQSDNAAKKGVKTTPTIFVNGEELENPTPARLTAAVDSAAAAAVAADG